MTLFKSKLNTIKMHNLTFLLLFLLISALKTRAINHWVVKDDGRIMQKIDSPFYMREPSNLIAFLNQIKYNDFVEKSYLELLRQREQIVEHLHFSVQFGEDLVEQAKCAMDYYLLQKRMSYLKVSTTYLQRLGLPNPQDALELSTTAEKPNCGAYMQLPADACCFNNLDSFQPNNLRHLSMDPEDAMNIAETAGSPARDYIRRLSVAGLKQQPRAWQYYTYSSFYWRMMGQAQKALECARLGLSLAPEESRDIPLLSMGTIIFRSGRLLDADILLTAAVEHAPHVPENHIALASALAMKHHFNRSLFHFDEAERLDPSLLPRTQPVRNFIACLENLTKKTEKMYSYVKYMENEVEDFKKLKRQIARNHELLMQQQVPLGARLVNEDDVNEELVKRGQYCSKRTLSQDEEPVLFCDFYSELQMRLESKEVDIESLEKDLKITSEAVLKQVSEELRKKVNMEQMVQATVPTSTTNSKDV